MDIAEWLGALGLGQYEGVFRENGIDAIKEFLQTKSVWVGLASVPDPLPKLPIRPA